MLPKCLTTLPLCADKDVLAEALLCFGASSVSMDQDDVSQSTDEVNLQKLFYALFSFCFLSNLFVLFVSIPTLWYYGYVMIKVSFSYKEINWICRKEWWQAIKWGMYTITI